MKSEKAFTLLEVILAIGIFAIVAIPIVSMFLDGIKITSKSENTSEAYAYAQQYVEKLKGGAIPVEDDKTYNIDAEYACTIDVKSTTQSVEADGEDFYQYMTDELSYKVMLSNTNLNSIATSTFDSIEIINTSNWTLKNNNTSVASLVIPSKAVSDTDINIWLNYDNLTEGKELEMNNKSGKRLNLYLQSTEANKDNLKIKNMGGIVNVYGPVVGEIPKQSGRKKTANVTVTVSNSRTKEHAELNANVTYYE